MTSDLTTKAAETRAGLVAELLRLADCDSRAGEPLGKCMRKAADLIEQQAAELADEKGARETAERGGELILADLEQAKAELAAERQRSDTLRVQRDGHAAELAEARAELAAQIAGHRLSAAHATRHLIERDGFKRPGVVLLDALRRYGFPMSEAAWRNTGDDAPVNAQASVEARALHRAAVAFFQAISGADHAG